MSTYTPIATINITGTTSSVTFSNIPQTYTDLILVTAGPSTAVQDLNCTFNGDTGSNYGFVYLYGDGSSVASGNTANATRIVVGRTGSDNTGIAQFYNYSNSNIRKTILSRTNRPSEITMGFCNVWRNTAAITSMTITPASGTLSAGYTLNLYGIANAGITNVAKATGGDTVVTDGTYWYHAFTSSGTFTPTQSITADVLMIAGGGSGGSRAGGGGGAGGVVYSSAQSLGTSNYTVTIGAGGAAVVSVPSNRGNNGSNTTFTGLTTAIGGGGGGVYPGTAGLTATTGGSGGGGGSILGSTSGAGAAGTSGQGNAGGNGASNAYHGGGGGGAGAAGSNGNISQGGNGGAGTSSYSSLAIATYTGQDVSGTRYFAGGGGGCANGVGGSGGGGNGSDGSSGNAVAGVANTGGGGGGARNAPDTSNVYSGAGGSGIVIVRYAV